MSRPYMVDPPVGTLVQSLYGMYASFSFFFSFGNMLSFDFDLHRIGRNVNHKAAVWNGS